MNIGEDKKKKKKTKTKTNKTGPKSFSSAFLHMES
jgi:hypothetical protein